MTPSFSRLVAVVCGTLTLGASQAVAGPDRDAGHAGQGSPTRVIFDTDMEADIDDAMALAMLHALQDRGEAKLLAVTVSTDDPWSASYVDLVDTFYGRPCVPIGLVRRGVTREDQLKFAGAQITHYTKTISQAAGPDGALVYPHKLLDGSKAVDATALLRKTLAEQADGSVVIVQVGFSTNLARLLDSPPDAASPLGGRDLVIRKVRLLSAMAGDFQPAVIDGKARPKGIPDWNDALDIPAARRLFADWPTPIVASGLEIGLQMLIPSQRVARDFSYVPRHPIADTYRSYVVSIHGGKTVLTQWPHDHATFDLTSVLYAVRPDAGYFGLSNPGKIVVRPDGGTDFVETADGAHRYLVVSESQKAKALEAMIELTTEPPLRAPADQGCAAPK